MFLLAAYKLNSNPDIFIGDYTFISISGLYSMIGDYDTLRVVNEKENRFNKDKF